MSTFSDIVEKYNDYSLDGPSAASREIVSLQFLSAVDQRFDSASETVGATAKLVVVIVESRLLDVIPGCPQTSQDLLSRLADLRQDLANEGWRPKFLKMTPYCGPLKKDGKTLLAIRELLRAIRDEFPQLAGVLLVGSFPHASIVRTWPQDCGNGEYRVGLTSGQPRPFDIVLGDLDGNWRSLYRDQADLEGYVFLKKPLTQIAISNGRVTLTDPAVTKTKVTVRDVFHLSDASYSISGPTGGPYIVQMNLACLDPESSAADKALANPVARPEIAVSRIDARCVAVQPPDPRLVRNGKPVATINSPAISFHMEMWKRDPALERKLLIDYLTRNHSFRCGRWANQTTEISLVESKGLGTTAANEGLAGLNLPRKPDVTGATLLAFTRWLKQPAVCRAIASHADRHSTQFRDDDPNALTDAALLEAECGGPPWRWIGENGQYVPSFKGLTDGNLYLYRTLWENRVLAGLPPSLMLHVGCDVANVTYFDTQHDQNTYGLFQNAAGLLFYANQLAIMCRVTWWNHGPVGFGNGLGASQTATMGDGWRETFERVANEAVLASKTTERKQSYTWNLVGDWTLRKYYAAPKSGHGDPWDGLKAIDRLALILRNDIYVKLKLPNPAPDDPYRSNAKQTPKSLTAKQRSAAVARVRKIIACLEEVECQLDGHHQKRATRRTALARAR